MTHREDLDRNPALSLHPRRRHGWQRIALATGSTVVACIAMILILDYFGSRSDGGLGRHPSSPAYLNGPLRHPTPTEPSFFYMLSIFPFFGITCADAVLGLTRRTQVLQWLVTVGGLSVLAVLRLSSGIQISGHVMMIAWYLLQYRYEVGRTAPTMSAVYASAVTLFVYYSWVKFFDRATSLSWYGGMGAALALYAVAPSLVRSTLSPLHVPPLRERGSP